mmetsp:Transcript_10757/g.18154  ORF Transcript_10757/g.18154 Transcript_10757/m.18154 type:complete len:94 (+) Transcript_10757:90-371(+)|eukprot:CAMPEP_0116542300 /NCGR_PEP_ID=MMETSP0397-20121206/942_1 /TAXON_ID=216820 /ORGANISM="Cyclophora tenuis, Strain ECT3854" /LENGTH=93 /DNA_ID=CAMNT_0004066299 /DNA_START=49 /DNA_END=330 /DNA_ORIENTATION=-
MMRTLFAFLLLLAVAAAIQPPNVGQFAGQPWYKDYTDDEKVESNRRKPSSKKTKEVSVKTKKEESKAKKDEHEAPGWFKRLSEQMEDGIYGME